MSEILTPGGKQSVPIINESGLYSLVLSDASCGKLPLDKPPGAYLRYFRYFWKRGCFGYFARFEGVLPKTPIRWKVRKIPKVRTNKTPALPKPGERGHLFDMTHLPYKAGRNSGSPACGGAVRSAATD